MSDLHSFEVSSQIHYYTALPIDQFRDAATREVAVPTGMLSKLLHHSESWQHLEIPTSLLAPVRLCLYIPDRAQYGRVQFQGGNSSTYSLPRWGSVHILNADDTVDGVVSAFMQGIKSALGFLDAPKDVSWREKGSKQREKGSKRFPPDSPNRTASPSRASTSTTRTR